MSAKDLMVDLESLGTEYPVPIVQIGACYFNRYSGQIGKEFLVTIDIFDKDMDKFCYEIRTLKWWLRQSPDAIQSVMHGKEKMHHALDMFRTFASGASCIWSHATFDFVALQNAFKVFGINPFAYKTAKDIRTLTSLARLPKDATENDGVKHNALDDCKYQVKYCVKCFNILKHLGYKSKQKEDKCRESILLAQSPTDVQS